MDVRPVYAAGSVDPVLMIAANILQPAVQGTPPAANTGSVSSGVSRVCGTCHTVLSPETHFCGACGAGCYIPGECMTTAAGAGVRNPLTVLQQWVTPEASAAFPLPPEHPANASFITRLQAATVVGHATAVPPGAACASPVDLAGMPPLVPDDGPGPSGPDSFMREAELVVDDLPFEHSGIMFWSSHLRGSLTVSANRYNYKEVMEWFNRAWAPGITLEGLLDSGRYGILDMRLASKIQQAVLRACAINLGNIYT